MPISRSLKTITISGCRVEFDSRSTAEAYSSLNPRNGCTEEQPMRRAAWEASQSSKQEK